MVSRMWGKCQNHPETPRGPMGWHTQDSSHHINQSKGPKWMEATGSWLTTKRLRKEAQEESLGASMEGYKTPSSYSHIRGEFC